MYGARELPHHVARVGAVGGLMVASKVGPRLRARASLMGLRKKARETLKNFTSRPSFWSSASATCKVEDVGVGS